MNKLTIALMVLSLVLGGVALATSADLHKATLGMDLSGFQKITDQEAQEIRGTGFSWGYLSGFGGYDGIGNPDCPQTLTSVITSAPQTLTDAIAPAPQTRTQAQLQIHVTSPVGNMLQQRDRTQMQPNIPKGSGGP